MSSKLIDMLVRHEGISLIPYVCPAGKLSIGVGHNMEAFPLSGPVGDYLRDEGELTRDMCFLLLEADISRSIDELTSNFSWFHTLDDVRQDALVDMCFNMGLSHFKEFKKMLAFLQFYDFRGASKEMIASKWNSQVGARCAELALMMLTGKYVGLDPHSRS